MRKLIGKSKDGSAQYADAALWYPDQRYKSPVSDKLFIIIAREESKVIVEDQECWVYRLREATEEEVKEFEKRVPETEKNFFRRLSRMLPDLDWGDDIK